jgi:YHS domain-containing protein
MFNLFKKTDPICGMKEQKGTGITKDSNWFCSQQCAKEFETKNKEINKKTGCC